MILVIDDDPEFREKAQVALAAIHAHGILFAESGKRALQLLEKFADEIAVALVDLNLPDMNGFELISQISRKHPKLRVVAVSAYGHAILDSAKIMGAAAILVSGERLSSAFARLAMRGAKLEIFARAEIWARVFRTD